MTTVMPEQILDLARRLAPADQRWLARQLQANIDAALPEQTTLDAAIERSLTDAYSLGRAAELVGATRWDLLDALQQRGELQRPGEERSVDAIDELADRLEPQRILELLHARLRREVTAIDQ